MEGWNGLRGGMEGGMGRMDGRMEWKNGRNRKRWNRTERLLLTNGSLDLTKNWDLWNLSFYTE